MCQFSTFTVVMISTHTHTHKKPLRFFSVRSHHQRTHCCYCNTGNLVTLLHDFTCHSNSHGLPLIHHKRVNTSSHHSLSHTAIDLINAHRESSSPTAEVFNPSSAILMVNPPTPLLTLLFPALSPTTISTAGTESSSPTAEVFNPSSAILIVNPPTPLLTLLSPALSPTTISTAGTERLPAGRYSQRGPRAVQHLAASPSDRSQGCRGSRPPWGTPTRHPRTRPRCHGDCDCLAHTPHAVLSLVTEGLID